MSSSFAVNELPIEYEQEYRKFLSEFAHISVRERNGVCLIKKLLKKDVSLTLDPTLILPASSYDMLAQQSKIKINEPFILVYMLKYAFDPYPYATEIIKEAYRQIGLKVVCIDFSRSQKLGIKNFTHLGDAISPQDFIWLFKHAELVITNSFHGAAFSINYGKSLYAVANPDSSDDRVANLLSSLGLSDRLLYIEDEIPQFCRTGINSSVSNKLQQLRLESMKYLTNALKS